MKTPILIFLICLFGFNHYCFADAPALTFTPTSTQTVLSIPGQAELIKAQEIFKVMDGATPGVWPTQELLEKHKAAARIWFEKAKNMGNAEAELDIYILYDCKYQLDTFHYPELPYLSEQLVQQTNQRYTECKKMFFRLSQMVQQSADQGNPYAQFQLAELYLRGDTVCDVKPNRVEALKWMRMAAGTKGPGQHLTF